jgi:glutathione S-transferase
MALKIYIDALSQPARALMMFVRAAKIPREEVKVSIGALQHKTDDYKKVNPFQKIPAIDHDGFKLAESVAILRYLARTFPVEDHWYPSDSKTQARVDEFLEWQHIGLRIHVSRYFASILMPHLVGLKEYDEDFTKKMEKSMLRSLDDFSSVFLQRGPFIAGDKISIADLIATGELEQPRLVNYDAKKARPIIGSYLERVRDEINPHYDEVHKILRKFQSLRAEAEKSYVPH